MDDNIKTCKKCGFVGDSSLFKRKNLCKKCHAIYMKVWREKNEEKRKKYNAEWIKNNPEKNKQRYKRYIDKNPEKYEESQKKGKVKYAKNNPEKRKESNKKYIKNNPAVKLMNCCSSIVNEMLKRRKTSKKGKSSRHYFSFTKDSLVEHIEKQFSLQENLDNNGNVWMNWNNQGKYKPKTWDDNDSSTWTWNLDHIIPKSNLQYLSMDELNFKICWHLKNLRPLSAKQNILDNNRRDFDKINKLKELIIKEIEKEEILFNNRQE